MISIQYSKVNQAYLIMWNDTVLTIQPSRAEVKSWLDDRNFTVSET